MELVFENGVSQLETCEKGCIKKVAFDSKYVFFDFDELLRMSGFKLFDELEQINRAFNRAFNLHDGKKYKSNILEYKKDYNGYHPTQKPVALLEDLIQTYSNEGNTVLDFTMGSGSTGVAAKNLNRKFIGIEKDVGYFEIARQRLGV